MRRFWCGPDREPHEEGAAISGENPLTVGWRVAQLIASESRLTAMRANAKRLGRPRAAAEVAEDLGRLVSDGAAEGIVAK